MADTYLDDQGNEIQTQAPDSGYLDDNGNEILSSVALPSEAPAGSGFGGKSHERILAEHQANTQAEAQQYNPGWLDTLTRRGMQGVGEELMSGAGHAIANTPQRLVGMVTGLAGKVNETAQRVTDASEYKGLGDNPIVNLPGEIGAGLVKGMTEPLIGPKSTGEAVAGMAIDTALGGAALKGAKVGSKLASKRHLELVDARLAKALAPEGTPGSQNFLRNLKEARANLYPTAKSWKDMRSFADAAKGAADKFFQDNYGVIRQYFTDTRIPGVHIAKGIVDLKNRLRPEQAAEGAQIADLAKKYGNNRDFTLAELEDYRSTLDAQLQKIEIASQLDRARLLKADPYAAALQRQVNATRHLINTTVDKVGNLVPGETAKVLRTYRSMRDIAERADKAAPKIELSNVVQKGTRLGVSEIAARAGRALGLGRRPGVALASEVAPGVLRESATSWNHPNNLVRSASKMLDYGRFRIGPGMRALEAPVSAQRQAPRLALPEAGEPSIEDMGNVRPSRESAEYEYGHQRGRRLLEGQQREDIANNPEPVTPPLSQQPEFEKSWGQATFPEGAPGREVQLPTPETHRRSAIPLQEPPRQARRVVPETPSPKPLDWIEGEIVEEPRAPRALGEGQKALPPAPEEAPAPPPNIPPEPGVSGVSLPEPVNLPEAPVEEPPIGRESIPLPEEPQAGTVPDMNTLSEPEPLGTSLVEQPERRAYNTVERDLWSPEQRDIILHARDLKSRWMGNVGAPEGKAAFDELFQLQQDNPWLKAEHINDPDTQIGTRGVEPTPEPTPAPEPVTAVTEAPAPEPIKLPTKPSRVEELQKKLDAMPNTRRFYLQRTKIRRQISELEEKASQAPAAAKPTVAQAPAPPDVEPVKLPKSNYALDKKEAQSKPLQKKEPKVKIAKEPKEPKPEFSPVAPSTLDVPLKQQKASLAQQIDDAIEAAKSLEVDPKKSPPKIAFKVPGAGEYHIYNNESALTEFKNRVAKLTGVAKQSVPSVAKSTSKRIVGEGIEYYNPFTPRKQELIGNVGKQIEKNYVHEGWYSNGHYAIKSAPPPGIGKTMDMPKMKDIVTPPADEHLIPAKMQGEFFYKPSNMVESTPSRVSYQPGYTPKEAPAEIKPEAKPNDEWMTHPVAHIVGEGADAMVDTLYADAILTKYPNAKPFLAKNVEGVDGKMVYFKDGDQVVAVIAKIKGEVPKRFEERIGEVKMGVEPIELPGKKPKKSK